MSRLRDVGSPYGVGVFQTLGQTDYRRLSANSHDTVSALSDIYTVFIAAAKIFYQLVFLSFFCDPIRFAMAV